MKLVNLSLIATVVTLSCTSCSSKKSDPVPTPDPLVELWGGEDSLYTPENNLRVTSVTVEDTKVVTATVADGKLLLKSVDGGNTVVRFTGNDNKTGAIRARVLTPFYIWKNLVNHATYKPRVTVKAADAALAASITAELTAALATTYTLQFIDEDSLRYRNAASVPPVQAKYSFKDLTFTLSMNDVTNYYKVITHKDRMILGLENDLTTRYRALHTGKDIESVVTVEYVQQQLPPG